jgi:two-component system, chemotaxis family, sensor kinase Cph1
MEANSQEELEFLRRRVAELEQKLAKANQPGIAVVNGQYSEHGNGSKTPHPVLPSEDDTDRQFQLLVQSSPLPIVVLTRNGDITLWNPAAERLFGWKAEEVLGGPLPFIPEEKRAEHRALRERDLRGDAIKDFEIQRVRKDGSFLDLRVSTALLHDETGAVTGIVSLYADLTEQKRAAQESEAARKRMERQWRLFDTALSHTPDHSYIFDREGRLVYANRVLLGLWQKSWDEARGRTLAELGYPPELREKVERQFRAVFETKKPLRDEVSLGSFTASPRQYEYIFVPVFGAEGEVEAVAGSSRDITDRHEARTALEKANRDLEHTRQQLITIFESMTDAFFALDNDWRFSYVNHHAEKILFRTRKELVGKNVWEEFAPAVGSTFYHEYHRAKSQGVPVEFEAFYEPLKAWFEVRAYPSPEGLGVYFHRINERKAAQEALRRQAEELARINADLEHFAYAAAHDLQEPLRMVSIFTQLLKRRYQNKLDEQGEQYINYAVNGAKRMEMMVRDLLAYTQAAIAEEDPKQPVDTENVLEKTLSTLAPAIEESGAIIVHTTLPPITVYEVHLQQLFQNLIGNALKYRREEPPRIHIAAEEHGSMWRFEVKDNGIGIEDQYREHVFGLFKRLHSKEEYEGTGIGLAICQKIVQRYGGEIWVESQSGQGSTFFFTVPR